MDMRSLMKLCEAPISDIHLVGDVDNADIYGQDRLPGQDREHDRAAFDRDHGAFSDTDQKLLRSEKGQAKIIRAFRKTKFDFEIFFANTFDILDDPRENERVDDIAGAKQSGVHDSYGFVHGRPGVIRVVMLSNLSPMDAKMPMTGWTLAHKIGHVFQDHINNRIESDIDVVSHHDRIRQLVGLQGLWPGEARAFGKTLTMKSAREGKLDNPFEMFAEIIAQYLVTGRVSLGGKYEQRAASPDVQAEIEALMAKCVGKVLVEV